MACALLYNSPNDEGRVPDMSVNFCPSRDQMLQEIDRCVASSMIEVLHSLCRCCVYNIFAESTLIAECGRCHVRHGIRKISPETTLLQMQIGNP